MLSVKLFGAGDLRLVHEDIPKINDYELLIKVKKAAVCGTDVRSWKFGKDFVNENNPLVLGHEIAGVIEEAGKNTSGFERGMRVAYVPCSGCGVCDLCTHGNTHQCEKLVACGINYDGLMAEYVVAPKEAINQGNIFVVDDGLSDEEIALCEPFSCVYNGFLELDVKCGDTALVIGAGPIGIMHAQMLRLAGCKVLMTELLHDRAELAKKILPYINMYEGENLKAFVLDNTEGRGLDIGITACPDPKAQQEILPLMRHNGRVHFFGGVPKEMQPVAIDTNIIHYKALHIVGSTCSNVWEYRKVIELVKRGDIMLKELVTAEYSKEDAIKAFENAKNCIGLKNIISFE